MTSDHAPSLNCREFVDFIIDYNEGVLSAGERRVFEEHMSLCPACDQYLKTYDATIVATQELCDDKAPPPGDAPESLIQAIIDARRGGA